MINLYCERVGPGLLAEPINALSNLAFFIAAWAAWSLARRSSVVTAELGWLLALTLAIGTGSTLFHTFSTGWARVLDEVPILLFQLWFVWIYARRVMTQPRTIAALLIAAYLGAAFFSRQFPHLLNGSLIYAPALILLSGLGLYHFLQGKPERWLLLATAGVFVVSVTCRSVDKAVCDIIPIGTHFLWHVLNGVVLYLSMRAFIVGRDAALHSPRQ
jgi:hypothetical protein